MATNNSATRRKYRDNIHNCLQLETIGALLEHNKHNAEWQKMQNGRLKKLDRKMSIANKHQQELKIEVSNIKTMLETQRATEKTEREKADSRIKFWTVRIGIATLFFYFFGNVVWPAYQMFITWVQTWGL